MSTSAATKLEGRPAQYRQREPQAIVLHKLVSQHLEPFLDYTRENYRKPLPKHVERELRRYLDCGDVLSRSAGGRDRDALIERTGKISRAKLELVFSDIDTVLERRG